jgi:hypothetical protein
LPLIVLALALLGQEPQAATLNPIIYLSDGAVLGVAGLELLGTSRGVRTLHRRRVAWPTPALGPQILLPLAGYGLVALLLLVLLLTRLFGYPLQLLIVSTRDLG